MSDYRDPRNDPLDPAGTTGLRDSMQRSNSGLGWIAGAIFLVVVLALIFGLGRQGDQSATSTGSSPPVTTGAAPPSTTPPAAPRTTTGQGAGQ
jgi:hypothetical protein